MRTPAQYARDMVGSAFGADVMLQQIEKSLDTARQAGAEAGQPVSHFWDPISLFMGREWLLKRGGMGTGGLTFHDLRRMSTNPIIASIIQTRLNQAASFMVPSTGPHDPGFRIVSDDEEAMKDTETVQALTQFVLNCGLEGFGEGSLEILARKCLRDSLVLDQCCAEVVPRRNQEPGYVVAVDGATIRRLKRSLEFYRPPGEDPFYAQIIQDKIAAQYTARQLMYGIRNPQTNVHLMGYGMSELEFLFQIVATILNASRFNASLLSQGGINKGILVVRKPPERGAFNAFKRDFREAYRNAAQFWDPPVLGVPEGAEIDWVKLDQSQRDMEYAQLFDFLVKQACGVYQIDPAEVNWSIGAAGSRTTFESKQEAKLRASQRKGLKPLLNFFASWLTQGVVRPIDDRFRLEFVGVAENRREMAEVVKIEVSTSRTINEVRADRGDPSIPGGDIILAPEYIKAITEFLSPDEEEQMAQQLEDQMMEVEVDEGEDPDAEEIVEGVQEDER